MFKKTKLLIILILVCGTFLITPFIHPSRIMASDISLKYESVNPNQSFGYSIKRLKEKVLLFVYSISPSKKADYYNVLTNSRLAELKYVIDKKDADDFELATKRYFTTAGQYVEYLNKKNLNDKKGIALETLKQHEPILIKLRDTFDPLSAQYRFVEDDINYIKQYELSLK